MLGPLLARTPFLLAVLEGVAQAENNTLIVLIYAPLPHTHTHMCAKDARFMAKKVMGQSSWLSLWLAEEAAVKVAGAGAREVAGAVCEGCGVCLVRGLPA